MAQQRANPPRSGRAGQDSDVDPGTGKITSPPDSTNDPSSIDKLLAMTDDGEWSLDDQVRSLQAAADESPRARAEPLSAGRMPSLAQPTPYELAPHNGSSYVGPPPAAPSSPPPDPGGASGSRPPPLPTRAVSKPPPPLPNAAARRGPPPLPRTESSAPPPLVVSRADATGGSSRRSLVDPQMGIVPTTNNLIDLLLTRVATLESGEDRVGLARAHMELAIAFETLTGDDLHALNHAEAALKVDPRLAAAHAFLRRRKHGRGSLAAMLAHLERELSAASDDAAVVELLAEKARLLDASGEQPEVVRQVWEQALARSPQHPAALRGLEGELTVRAYGAGASGIGTKAWNDAWESLATHLGRMADAYAQDPRLAAALHVERAQILEWKLRSIPQARAALELAVSLDPSVGSVRHAAIRHIAAHGDWSSLAALLDEEAGIEVDTQRAARLELDAACVVDNKLGDPARAIQLLTRAARRAPSSPAVDRRVLDELVRLHEQEARWTEAAWARRARLKFITDPRVTAYEHRLLARIGERLEDIDAAIGDIEAALALEPNDTGLLDNLDRLLSLAGRDERRVALWVSEASRLEDHTKRARALVRAAQIAEDTLARPTEAINHLRAAWVACPGDTETLDALSRLLAPAPSERVDGETRNLVDLYAQAAAAAHDRGRRVAYLEKIALLWEDVLGDSRRAARVYEEILKLEPDRRGAVLGLARTATRAGDDKALSRALLDEARLAADGVDVLTLRVRAATSLARIDSARALALVEDVLEVDGAHGAARALETRLHEEAGRWDRAAESIRARIEHAPSPKERLSLWLALGQIQDLRLRDPKAAMASFQAARGIDPTHPVPPEEIPRMLEASGDHAMLRAGLEQLAATALGTDERVRHLLRAAEIDEMRLGDDARAAMTYARALAETPDEEIIAERLERVLSRRAAQNAADGTRSSSVVLGELVALQSKRIERASTPVQERQLSYDLASLLLESGKDLTQAEALLELVLREGDAHYGALRMMEVVSRRSGDWSQLARVLSDEGGAYQDVRARLGSLWSLAAIEEWRLPVAEGDVTYARILQHNSEDPSALEATVRRELANARRGDPRARKAVISALRVLYAGASDDGARLAIQLRLALLLEAQGEGSADATSGTSQRQLREAMERYRSSLHMDDLSVTAATGLARTATRLRDAEGAVAAAVSLAELAGHPRARARYLLDAAEILLGPDGDGRLGPTELRRRRAIDLLEKALESDADAISVAGRLAAVRQEDRQSEKIVDVFRAAIVRARNPDAIIMLGSEIARVGRDELHDLPLAIDAMRKVREAAPQHVPSLLTLAELCLAQRSWPEAVDALEAVVAIGREPGPRLTALFALASTFEHVLSRPEDAERALRTALGVDPVNARALRALLRHITQVRVASAEELSDEDRVEVADLLERLTNVERDPEQRCELLLELAEMRAKVFDSPAVERALVEAVAQTPGNLKAFGRFTSFYRGSSGRDNVAYARGLGVVIARGQQLGRVDASWLAVLGQIEIDHLQRARDGIAHLQQAVQLDSTLYETRFELARAFVKVQAHDEAVRVVLGMIAPSSTPLLGVKEPAAALALLEQSLNAERRAEEALVISELRAIGGDLDEGRQSWLRSRRLAPIEAHHSQLDRPALVTHVLPPEGRHVMLEVAAAVAGIESKILRADLTEIGISPRDRVSPRSGHPTRALLDRLSRTLGLADVELVITPTVARTRVLAQDTLWVVVPRAVSELPEPSQLASLGRALTRISLGVPWLEELPPPHIEALLIACARQVVHGYGADELDVLSQKLVAQYEPNVARVLSRRQRKLLEELAPHIGAPQGRPIQVDVFIGALARAELRSAALLTGDLLATLDELRGLDASLFRATDRPGVAALRAVLEHPFAGDVSRYALSGEAIALRRRVGSAWTG